MATLAPIEQTEQAANLRAFRRLIGGAFSAGDLAVVDEVIAPDHVEHQPGFDPPNREGIKGGIAFLHTLSPDIEVSVEDSVAVGDKVWARLRARGSHGGAVLGGPTERRFDITVMDVCRFAGGRIVEHWGVPDRFTQMQQLGLMPGETPEVDR
jgi:predicted SnoaL-like aldol condensation-catalyzing enzyme